MLPQACHEGPCHPSDPLACAAAMPRLLLSRSFMLERHYCPYSSINASLVHAKCVTRRKLQTPGTPKEHQRQETSTISPNNRQPAQLTDQAPGTIERAVQESRRITTTSTAAVHASSKATTRHHYPHLTGSPLDPLSQRTPLRSTGGLSHTTTQTPPASAGTRSVPRLGGPMIRSGWWTAKGAQRASGDEGGGGRAKSRERGG